MYCLVENADETPVLTSAAWTNRHVHFTQFHELSSQVHNDSVMTMNDDQSQHATEYEDYKSTSGQYDETRRSVGIAFITEALTSVGPLDEHALLDAGCGTGLVGIELKKNGFDNLDGADFSQKMLDLIPKDIYQNL